MQMLNKLKSLKSISIILSLKKMPKIIGIEAAVWIGALVFLALINNPNEIHYTICPIQNLGSDFCPGCGLGNSISYIFRGDIYKSLGSHPLGIFALLVLLIRINKIIKQNWSNYGKHITINALS